MLVRKHNLHPLPSLFDYAINAQASSPTTHLLHPVLCHTKPMPRLLPPAATDSALSNLAVGKSMTSHFRFTSRHGKPLARSRETLRRLSRLRLCEPDLLPQGEYQTGLVLSCWWRRAFVHLCKATSNCSPTRVTLPGFNSSLDDLLGPSN